ncbi:MAG: Crp/Fnr family transcriptional regulator [Spirochaetaceae bacterium]
MDKRDLLAVAQSPIFKGIEITDLHKILELHHPSIKRFTKGQTVLIQDQFLDKLIIVIDGRLKAQMASDDGKIINMEEFGKYMPIAIPVLFSEEKLLPVSLYAIEPSEVFFLSKEMLIKCCMENQRILENTMGVMSGKVSFLSKKIKFLQLNTIKQKIAETLLKLSKSTNSLTFKLNLTKEDLAKEMGVTRPSLSREFASLVQGGIITQDKDNITILDPENLKNYK